MFNEWFSSRASRMSWYKRRWTAITTIYVDCFSIDGQFHAYPPVWASLWHSWEAQAFLIPHFTDKVAGNLNAIMCCLMLVKRRLWPWFSGFKVIFNVFFWWCFGFFFFFLVFNDCLFCELKLDDIYLFIYFSYHLSDFFVLILFYIAV